MGPVRHLDAPDRGMGWRVDPIAHRLLDESKRPTVFSVRHRAYVVSDQRAVERRHRPSVVIAKIQNRLVESNTPLAPDLLLRVIDIQLHLSLRRGGEMMGR
jgi:hypothetical protein